VTAIVAREPAIRVQGIEKSFKELHVLRGVDFEVKAGSIFALLGLNGAGKTTLVRILSTVLKGDAGTAIVHGFDVATHANKVRESISLTGQFAAVDDVLTGRENLVLIARLRHAKNPAAIADELLARCSLVEAGGRRAATYSGGMRGLLEISTSLIGNPPIILLDELTTGLDPQARIEVWQMIKKLARDGTTVLLTTQYLDEVEQLADRIAILGSVAIVIGVALILGFRTGASVGSWLAVGGILVLFILALTWLAMIAGLSAKTVDGASAFSYPLIFLPFGRAIAQPSERSATSSFFIR